MTWHDTLFGKIGNAVFDGPFGTLWPLLLAPALAALVSDRAARTLPPTPAAWPWAAILAVMPGLVALAEISEAIEFGTVLTWRGVISLWLTPSLAAGFVIYAAARAVRRQLEVRRLFGVSRPAGERLALAAERLGLRAREIPSADNDCFVAGLLRPTVFVSTGALDQLSDEELAAALYHERAHVQGRDTLTLALLAFFRDLSPWGRGAALEAFRAAREANADRFAAASAGPLNLASALIALARNGSVAPAGALSMARPDNLAWRMRALLYNEAAPNEPLWWRMSGGLGFSAFLLVWPLFNSELMHVFCDYY